MWQLRDRPVAVPLGQSEHRASTRAAGIVIRAREVTRRTVALCSRNYRVLHASDHVPSSRWVAERRPTPSPSNVLKRSMAYSKRACGLQYSTVQRSDPCARTTALSASTAVVAVNATENMRPLCGVLAGINSSTGPLAPPRAE